MRLKEIKPGMVIHCKNDNELSVLLKECEIKGYVWFGTGNKPTNPALPIKNIICLYDDNYGLNITHTSNSSKANTEFSDLIISELPAEELVPILTDICKTFVDEECNGCPLNGLEHVANGNECPFTFKDYFKVVEICAQWKADHEKKEPEIEWVYKAVADIVCCNEMEFFDTEEAAIEWCERRTIETGNNHAYVRVCRKKGSAG